MQISEINNSRVHDLLQIHPEFLPDGFAAEDMWVRETLTSCPWVVVRRAQAPAGQIAVGVRGATRSLRWAGFFSKDLVSQILRPAELLVLENLRSPALKALQKVVEAWQELTLPWGPTGSVGFELASGREVTTDASDLDIAIRAQERISVTQARSLWERVSGLRTKVDILIETPVCGFSLREYTSSPAQILLRCPDGVRLGKDPWAERSHTMGTSR
jgi:phosphoribosyl-dephospho-CoA transferase